jgi:hypothetical protein
MQQAGEGKEAGAVAPEITNPKLQIPRKFQKPTRKKERSRGRLPLKFKALEFLWSLELGIWSFPH